MLNPPPIAIECLLLSKIQEVKKQSPERANKTKRAPMFNKISSPYVKPTDSVMIVRQIHLVRVVSKNIARSEPIK